MSRLNLILRFSLATLLGCTAMIAFYLGGRVPLERQLAILQRDLLNAQAELKSRDEAAEFWHALAMDARTDLRESAQLFQDHSAARYGVGGSFQRMPNDSDVKPRSRRWQVRINGDEADYISTLEEAGIRMFAIRGSTVLEVDWKHRKIFPSDLKVFTGNLVLPASQQDFSAIPDEIMKSGIDCFVKMVPSELEKRFAIAEMQYCSTTNQRLVNVLTTEFLISRRRELLEIQVSSQSLR